MLFLTRCFGVTGSDAERSVSGEQAVIEAITERVLMMQAKAAAQQHRPLRRGTHAKGICVQAQFEVLDVTVGRDPVLGARLAKGIFAKPGIYPAIVRFANSDSKVNSDFKADVRSLSFSVDLTSNGATALLEQRAFPSRTERGGEAVRDSVPGQFDKTSAKEQPKRLAGRVSPARQRR